MSSTTKAILRGVKAGIRQAANPLDKTRLREAQRRAQDSRYDETAWDKVGETLSWAMETAAPESRA
jgi:hypothetical protein